MPRRAIIKGREQVLQMVRTAQDPDAAEQRFKELEKMEKNAKVVSERETAVSKVEEELRLKEIELAGRERQHWEKEDSFYKEQASKRHSLEQREHEAEDLIVKASDWQRAAEKRHAELDERERVVKTAESKLQDNQNAFAEQQQVADRRFAEREQKSLNAIAEREKAVTAREAAVASYANDVAEKERAVASERDALSEKRRKLAEVLG